MTIGHSGASGGCADQPREYDLSNGDCRDILLGLFNASLAIVSGNAVTRIRIGDRWTDYSRGNYAQLTTLYTTLYSQCRASGVDLNGLPSMSPGDRVQRGAPGRFLRGQMPHF